MSKKKHPFTSNITVNKNIKRSDADPPLPKTLEMIELLKKYPYPRRTQDKLK